MSAATVFQTLAARGAVVTVRGDVLSITPRAVIDEPLRAEIRARKSELLELLSAPQKAAASTCTTTEPTRGLVLRGQTVVANKHRDRDLIAWATAHDLAAVIMRPSKWGNPFQIGRDGDRDEVCERFKSYLSNSPELCQQIGELKGKVLVCCCHPKRCHGDALAQFANSSPHKPALQVHEAPSTCSRVFCVRAAYEPALAAAYARKLYRQGKVTAEQRDSLLHYANEAADNATAPQVLAG
jgi:hypothetical protein